MGEDNFPFRKHSKEFKQRERTAHLGKINCIGELGIGGIGPGEVRNESRGQAMNIPIFHGLDVKRDVLKC